MLAHVARFEPQFCILQCGADSIAGDPITHLQLSTACHARAAADLCTLADSLGHGHVLALGGGGYDRGNLARAWSDVVRAAEAWLLGAADRVQFRRVSPHPTATKGGRCMFSSRMRIKDFDPELQRALDGERARQEDHIELIASENYASPAGAGGAGLGADQQVRRRLSGQALLRRLRIRRYRRATGDRSRQEIVRRRLCQRATAFGFTGECRGVPGVAVARRSHPRHEPGSRRSSDARRQGQFLRQTVPGASIRRAAKMAWSTTSRSKRSRASIVRR